MPGFTEAGRAAAKHSAVRIGGGISPTDAVDWMIASVVNRNVVLNPTLKEVGFGAAVHAPRGWLWVLGMPTERAERDGPLATLCPGPDQADVPLYFGREIGALAADQPKGAAAGFAITAGFFPTRRVTKVKASLADGAGRAVDCWLSTPQAPLPATGGYNQIILSRRSRWRPPRRTRPR